MKGKAPALGTDVAKIIDAIPDVHYKKQRNASLFLFGHQSAQRSFTCHEVRIKDLRKPVLLANGKQIWKVIYCIKKSLQIITHKIRLFADFRKGILNLTMEFVLRVLQQRKAPIMVYIILKCNKF